MEWIKKHWKILAIAGVGVLGLYLLTQRAGGNAPSADAGLPPTGPPPQGNQTPQPSPAGMFGQSEMVASQLSHSELFRQQRQANSGISPSGVAAGGMVDQLGNQLTGITSKAWQQVMVGGQQAWEDIYHPGHIISEQQAQQLSPQNSGPYARGGGGFFGGLAKFISSLAPNLAASYEAGSPITLGSAFLGPKKQSNQFTPGIAPTPRYGNPPARVPSGGIPDSYLTA